LGKNIILTLTTGGLMKIRKILGAVLISLFMILPLAACGGSSQTAGPVKQTAAALGDLTTRINGSGKIAVINDAKLSFSSGGKLKIMNVKEGDKVAKGMLLARLDTDALELALSSAMVVQSQAQTALTSVQIAQTSANIALNSAQIALDTIKDVSDLEDDVTEAEW
jgi:multidrug efflux pump subunit AcrA (membrane-fusion protein)